MPNYLFTHTAITPNPKDIIYDNPLVALYNGTGSSLWRVGAQYRIQNQRWIYQVEPTSARKIDADPILLAFSDWALSICCGDIRELNVNTNMGLVVQARDIAKFAAWGSSKAPELSRTDALNSFSRLFDGWQSQVLISHVTNTAQHHAQSAVQFCMTDKLRTLIEEAFNPAPSLEDIVGKVLQRLADNPPIVDVEEVITEVTRRLTPTSSPTVPLIGPDLATLTLANPDTHDRFIFTNKDIRLIRKMAVSGNSPMIIADRLGFDCSTVERIINGQLYANIT